MYVLFNSDRYLCCELTRKAVDHRERVKIIFHQTNQQFTAQELKEKNTEIKLSLINLYIN